MKEQINFKNFLYTTILVLFYLTNSFALENKIIFKINNEIITSYDLENEINYLSALNPNFKKINQNEKIRFSKKSIVQEKIKKIEILKNFDNPKLPDEYLDSLMVNIYTKLGIKNLINFKTYLKSNNINYNFVLSKIETEALWNELIFLKFSNKVKINENQLLKKIVENQNNISKSYLMSEILFEVNENENVQEKYQQISKVILNDGFENAALKYSISETAKSGGELNWINENSLNNKIKKELKKKEKNQFTNPITLPGGFLILKINDIKETKIEKNTEQELKKLIAVSKNNQLNQFSIMYFNRVKEDLEINEI